MDQVAELVHQQEAWQSENQHQRAADTGSGRRHLPDGAGWPTRSKQPSYRPPA
jgi:hypothetical protein